MIVLSRLRKNCEEMLALDDRNSAQDMDKHVLLEENVIALDAALESRWAHEQGPDGLVQLVMDAINAMIEVRMWLEYGDHLAIHCVLQYECGSQECSGVISV